ncbi:MAG: hypothetical protein D6765_14130 [Bacteroidetes bacterium]|nr:MAG: hypothetical protein D6765_14130 [Bacteroidota bacterium]
MKLPGFALAFLCASSLLAQARLPSNSIQFRQEWTGLLFSGPGEVEFGALRVLEQAGDPLMGFAVDYRLEWPTGKRGEWVFGLSAGNRSFFAKLTLEQSSGSNPPRRFSETRRGLYDFVEIPVVYRWGLFEGVRLGFGGILVARFQSRFQPAVSEIFGEVPVDFEDFPFGDSFSGLSPALLTEAEIRLVQRGRLRVFLRPYFQLEMVRHQRSFLRGRQFHFGLALGGGLQGLEK